MPFRRGHVRLSRRALAVAAVAVLGLGASTTVASGALAAQPKAAATGIWQITGGTARTVSAPQVGAAMLKGLLPPPVPVGGAKLVSVNVAQLTNTIEMPVTGGTLDPAALLTGSIEHSGGLRFVNPLALRSVTVSNFSVKSDANPRVVARVDNNPKRTITLFTVDLSGLTLNGANGNTLTMGNVKLLLTQEGANTLNTQLKTKVFAPGTVFGTSTTTFTYKVV